MIQRIFPSNIFSLHFCRSDTYHKLSFRQQEFTLLLFKKKCNTPYVDIRYVENVHSPVIDIANLSVILDNDLTDLLDVLLRVYSDLQPFK